MGFCTVATWFGISFDCLKVYFSMQFGKRINLLMIWCLTAAIIYGWLDHNTQCVARYVLAERNIFVQLLFTFLILYASYVHAYTEKKQMDSFV